MTDPINDRTHEELRLRGVGPRDADRSTPLRVLFLCTGNSARSQIAEALLTKKGAPWFQAGSAGVAPAARVHPDAVTVLREYGIDWTERRPKTVETVLDQSGWDFVVTVCDRARESCPTIPGRPVFAHWGMPDPAAIEDPVRRQTAFHETLLYLSRRIDLMLALPFESLERQALTERLRQIGRVTPDAADVSSAEA